MNAAFKNLIVRAHDKAARMEQEYYSQGASASDFFPEILAELIVKECTKILDEDTNIIPELGVYAHDICKHFGIKYE